VAAIVLAFGASSHAATPVVTVHVLGALSDGGQSQATAINKSR
jgi:hypothetical protein